MSIKVARRRMGWAAQRRDAGTPGTEISGASGAHVRPPMVRLYEDEEDLVGFAGGGGSSEAIKIALGQSPIIAINHDPIAMGMHEVNHPRTRHIISNIRHVRYEKEVPPGVRLRVGWFSPDCTHHSKARGGKPFRDPLKARRIRGLAWEAVRCAKALVDRAPRLIIIENVEEWRDWCPLLKDGTPDWTRKGENYRRWKREMAKAGPGYVIEERELVACDYGDPTKRKRLFIICRSDGQAIVWPEPTHGPGRAHPYRTAAECIDFSLPVPSIFLTQALAYAWAKAQGLPKASAPRRPLATATKRRIARGVFRYVINEPHPFIVKYHGAGAFRGQALDEPLRTLDTSNRFGLVTPFLAPVTHPRDARVHSIEEPLRTITCSERGEFALVAPTLINTRNGERDGQAPRVIDIRQPYPTVTALGSQGALVAAFLAKHHGNGTGHDATGQKLSKPIDTIITRDNKSLVTSHLLKLRGGLTDHAQTAQDLRQPAPTLTAGGTHVAEVRITLVPRTTLDSRYIDRAVQTCAFLVKYFGTGVARPLSQPIGALTTKDRLGLVEVILVRVGDTEWVLADIGMRMLTPRELFLCQGFEPQYEIDKVSADLLIRAGYKLSKKALKQALLTGKHTLTKKAQTRLVGNSVPPNVAAAIIRANLVDRPAMVPGVAA
jgi:DNA (cytosine-5)-methyltransferase 1